MLSTAKAVFFDFDGIILDTEWPIYEVWRKLFQREGQDLHLDMYVKCIGSDFDTWSPQTYLEHLTGKTYDWVSERAMTQQEIVAAVDKLHAMPGVQALFDKLQASDTPIFIVSSSTHDWVDRWLDKLKLTSYCAEIICKGDAPRIKPAPDLYLEAVKRSGLPASECLVIEDSLNGIKAAIAAGTQTLAVPNRLTAGLDFSLADHVRASLEEV